MIEWFRRLFSKQKTPLPEVTYLEYEWAVQQVSDLTTRITAAEAVVGPQGVWFRDKHLNGILFVPLANIRSIRRLGDNTTAEKG